MFYPIKLDKMRNFRYTVKTIDLIERQLKKSLTNANLGALTVRETIVFIWAGLVHEDRKLTIETVMDLLDDFSEYKRISGAASEAFALSIGAGEEQEDSGDGEKNAQGAEQNLA